jgi:hypothetical protein
VIRNGIRMTGMPSFGKARPTDDQPFCEFRNFPSVILLILLLSNRLPIARQPGEIRGDRFQLIDIQ